MTTAISRRELVWPNLAKAGCILLVVLMHLGEQVGQMPWVANSELEAGWHVVNGFIRPVRMPLFFLVSGLLASDSIMRPRADTQRNRLVKPLYLYFTWGLIYQFFLPMDAAASWTELTYHNHLVPVLLLARMSWYLVALGIYYLLTRITLPLPVWATLLLCAVLSVLGTVFEGQLAAHEPKMLRCAIFFVAGVRMKDEILAFVERASASRVLLLGAGYLAGAALALKSDTFLLPVDVLAVAAGAMLCVLVARRGSVLIRPASWLAKRTLPIYLLHFLMMPALAFLIERWAAPVLGSVWAGAIYPLVAVPVVVVACLAGNVLLVRTRAAGWLMDLPTWQRPAPKPSATVQAGMEGPVKLAA
ncbi:acyltransferase family protein [Novosphingobium guangzhouense]|uniref:Acyltransferase 3 domain-containing protein n=1 Tax=Novosphingobium guangzhouense TaxID=1850347 RepID=A0A2K2FZ38_9SPHN|nr:acyltransferase [Novosphingobium guangzhouense]PNU04022.1 hypothetical protein A8V01_05250 [Novosphingobium guangzhouense]